VNLVPQAKKYKQKHGCHPERICADRIYINTKDKSFCTRNNILLSGKRLVRPPRDPSINAAHKQQLSADQRKRNEAEAVFGSGKRKYSLQLIMARLPEGAEISISMAFLVMCAVKILRLLRLLVLAIYTWFCPWQRSGWPWVALRNISMPEITEFLVTALPSFRAAYPSGLRLNLNTPAIYFSGVPNSGLLKKPDRLQHNLFQRSKPVKLAAYRAIDDCYNC
jgi:hypothetical protein